MPVQKFIGLVTDAYLNMAMNGEKMSEKLLHVSRLIYNILRYKKLAKVCFLIL